MKDVLIVTAFSLWATMIYFIGKYFFTASLHSASIKKLKESARKMENGATAYETNVNLAYSKRSYSSRGNTKGVCPTRLLVKKEGLLFKPYWGENFGLPYENIVHIEALEETNTAVYTQVTTIKSIGNVNDEVVFTSGRNLVLLDVISKYYTGQIILFNE